jgi:hypothetical protein
MRGLLALSSLMVLAAMNAPASEPALTPQQAMRRSGGPSVTVQLQVLSTYEYASLGLALSPDVKRDDGKDQFVVVLSPNAQQQLKRVGIHDLSRHFRGKNVRVAGRVSGDVFTGRDVKASSYRLTVEDVRQFEKVD